MTFADLGMLFRHFQFKVLIVNLYNLRDFLLHTCLFAINTLQKQNTTISRSQIKYKPLTQNKTKNFKLKSGLRAHIFTKPLKIVHNALFILLVYRLKKWHLLAFHWQHCEQRNTPVFNLLRSRFWGFSPHRGVSLA